MPAIKLSSVVLPEPLGPNTPTISPRAIEKETADTAVKPPNRLLRFLACENERALKKRMALCSAIFVDRPGTHATHPLKQREKSRPQDLELTKPDYAYFSTLKYFHDAHGPVANVFARCL